MMKGLIAAAAFALTIGSDPAAMAQGFPSRAITVIVPFATGGPTDVIARTLGQHMRATLGQTVIVENLAGANGNIGVGRGIAGILLFAMACPVASRGTPRDVIAKLNGAIVAALADPMVRSRLADLGQDIFPREQQTPAALGTYHKAEIEKWWPIIKAAGIKAD
jgi:tripartite-type tricarboxylate transporter receptor subunit TctC